MKTGYRWSLWSFLCLVVLLSGCAKFWNRVDADGGIFVSTKADYVVISQSGGEVMDCWKLKDVMVQACATSDGWLFKDQAGNSLFIGGDVKTIRLIGSNSGELWDNYHEYHMEFEDVTYRQKYPAQQRE